MAGLFRRARSLRESRGLGAAICVAATLLAFGLSRTEVGQMVEARTLDYRFRRIPRDRPAPDGVVLVAIDNGSLEYFADHGMSWPWPRDFYAHVTDYLAAAGARAIVFDMLFYEPDLERAETSAADTDGAFARSLARAGRAVLGVEVGSGVGVVGRLSHSLPVPEGLAIAVADRDRAVVPIPDLERAAAALGVTNVQPDPDGTIRRVPILYRLSGSYLAPLGLAAWIAGRPVPPTLGGDDGRLRIGERQIPVSDAGEVLVNWYRPGAEGQAFRYVPFSAVVQSASARLAGEEPTLEADRFAGAYVIIGATASGLMDVRVTPVGAVPGMETWATMLANVDHADFARTTPVWLDAFLALAMATATYCGFIRCRVQVSTPLLLSFPLLWVGLVLLLWQGHSVALNATLPLAAYGFSYVPVAVLSYLAEGRARQEIRGVFTRYVHPALVDRMLESPELIDMGGSESRATVLFTDVQDFTAYSEPIPPRELVTRLNSYFDRLAQLVLDHDGLLDKYTGDGLMAVFGVPIPHADHAALACRAALAHKRFCASLDAAGTQRVDAYLHHNTRIGINSGNIVTGNIGSTRRMDYTAIGDEVNLASRLQGLNRVYRTRIVLSESTFRLIGPQFRCRELDLVRVKGKARSCAVYELLDEDGAPDVGCPSWIDAYHRALAHYRQGRWAEAVAGFEALAGPPLGDGASAAMAGRCRALIARPPDGWDGVFTMETK